MIGGQPRGRCSFIAQQEGKRMNRRYQVAVVGSGSGGREAALVAARNGLRVSLIEKNTLGGTCLHSGCYSVRALRACAEFAKATSKSNRFGLEIAGSEAELPAWMTAQRRVSARLTLELEKQLERAGVEILFGQASLVGPNQIRLINARGGEKLLQADWVILASGSKPAFQDQTANQRFVNSDQLLKQSALPSELLIVGGGYIGCEFASLFRALGSTVTLVEKSGRLLPSWDESIGNFIETTLRSSGVDVRLGFKLDLSEPDLAEADHELTLDDGRRIDPDCVLVAIGRSPNTENLGLELLDIKGTPFIPVDEQLRTSSPTVFAIGDVNGLSLLDSAAVAQARVAVDAILGGKNRFSARWVPRCIHTDPLIASIGWNEDEAGKAGLELIAHTQSFRLLTDDERSVVDPVPTSLKILIQSESRQIFGVHVIGRQAAEIVNLASVAIRCQLTLEQLLEIPLVHPSATEALQESATSLGRVEVG
jgi:dihydrolipoamide dehydrogenase